MRVLGVEDFGPKQMPRVTNSQKGRGWERGGSCSWASMDECGHLGWWVWAGTAGQG